MSVEDAVRTELEALGPDVPDSALGALALTLAAQVDARVSWAVAKELRETLGAIRVLSPPQEQEDDIERARRRRVERLARQSASGAPSSS